MQLSPATRTLALNAHEFADFTAGPALGTGGRPDLWRAQLGQTWHGELRQQLEQQDPSARFELPIDVTFEWRGWRVRLTGRVDQTVARNGVAIVREVKTVLRPLPASADDLRREYPGYFRQLAAYQCLFRTPPGAPTADPCALAGLGGAAPEAGTPSPEDANPGSPIPTTADTREGAGEPPHTPPAGVHDHAQAQGCLPGELVFVEPATGVVQVVAQDSDAAWRIFATRLDELWAFAEQRRQGLERLRGLRFAPAFAQPRPGQETIVADLRAAAERSPVVLFEAPTGFGKTGCTLEYALGELARGALTRLIYLTGKSTGQLQVVRQLDAMVGHPPGASWWQIRNKAEHCINDVYHCFRDACRYLDGQEERWPASGLQRFSQDPALPRDTETLRAAGREAQVCPYEITRAALPFTDIWIADYNYVFAPANRSFLANLPGHDPAQTLLVIDEAHNLPMRVADAYSSELTHEAARYALGSLDALGVPAALAAAWEKLTLFLGRLAPAETLDETDHAELLDHLALVARHLQTAALDYTALGPRTCEILFQVAGLHAALSEDMHVLPELAWVPERGVVRFTCLDASSAIADTLREFGHVVFLSATLAPVDVFARQCGLDRLDLAPAHVVARTPWRDDAYDVAVDVRVDTRYERRARHLPATAASIAAMHAAGNGPVVVFFPSYAYANNVRLQLDRDHPQVRAALQPRVRDLAEQTRFIEESLALADVILLVLGSSFAESIDLLGGRVAGAVVVGPALPEVNAVQRAKLDASRAGTRDAAFREVYQIPGMQKVNQALGRLVRAPGQHARVLLHCRRFAEPSYQSLLAPEYRQDKVITGDAEFNAWLQAGVRTGQEA